MRLLRNPGIPRVYRGQFSPWWCVRYPDPYKTCGYECCPMEDFDHFDTWREAVCFALSVNPGRKDSR